MNLKTSVTKFGESNYLLIPKPLIDIYDILKDEEKYEFEIIVSEDKKSITYKKVKKQDEAQTKIVDFEKK